jgi:RHS repeat-associated protein
LITGLNTKKNTYAFGMPMPGRNYNSSNYSYGFGGKRKDDEIAGNGNYYDYDARMYDPRLGRTPSTDPLANKYPFASPYVFCLNNPILFVDKDGREVFIYGADAGKAVAALQTKTSLQLSFDSKTGQLTALGKPQTKLDQELLKAINDKGIKVGLHTTKENSFTSKDGSTQPINIGGYDGSEKKTETVEGQKKEIVETKQYINMDQSDKAEKAGVSSQGSDVFHEVIESYYGGQNDPGGTYDDTKWNESHNKAHAADPSATQLDQSLNPETMQSGLGNQKTGKQVDLRPMTPKEKVYTEKNKPKK